MSNINSKIKEFIESKPVAIFMKGTPDAPQCGFSAQSIEALRSAGVSENDLAYFDVLSDEEVRQGVKQYSNWPTIPQVYIKGEFLGGSDIILEMAQNGELKKKLE